MVRLPLSSICVRAAKNTESDEGTISGEATCGSKLTFKVSLQVQQSVFKPFITKDSDGSD